ncbi:hypothetical protein B0H14DRAFT_3137785, partial [Mycena olivaceomarginata]
MLNPVPWHGPRKVRHEPAVLQNEEGLRPGDIPHLWPPRPCCLCVHIHPPSRRRHGPRERFPFIHRRPRIFPSRFYLPPHILTSPEPTAEASLEHHFGGVANEPYETRKVPRPRRRQCVAHRQCRSQLSEMPQRQSFPERRRRGDQQARSHPKRQRWVSFSHTEAVDQPAPHCPPLRTHPSAPLGPPSRPPFVRPCPATPLSFSNPARIAASRCILRQHKAPRLPRTLLTQLGILPRPRRMEEFRHHRRDEGKLNSTKRTLVSEAAHETKRPLL